MSDHDLHFDKLPSLGAFYRRALFARKPGLKVGQSIPQIRATVAPLVPEPSHVALFRDVCGFRDDGFLPLSYPHVLAAPLHFALLMAKPFPFKALGLVHVSNRIVSHRPLRPDDSLDISTWVEGQRDAPRGILFDLNTRIESGGELVWESVSTIIRIQKGKGGPSKKKRREPSVGIPAQPHRTAIWPIPKDMGRRYAKPSGDFNPIHLSALTAKLFGFKRAIVHGMWALARCIGELEDDIQAPKMAVEVAFKRPIFLPSRVLFAAYAEEGGMTFGLHSADGSKPHLTGSVKSF